MRSGHIMSVHGLPQAKGLRSLVVFPVAALFNSFSMTGLLLLFGLAGQRETAADIGLVQAATLALFFAFSANARNLVLGDESGRSAAELLSLRLLLMLPLAGAAYVLSVQIGNASPLLALVLITRRLSEWLGEIGLAEHERREEPLFATQFLGVECIALLLACLALLTDFPLPACLLAWALAPLVAVRGAALARREQARPPLRLRLLLPNFGSTAAIGTSTYVFRVSLALLAGKALAGELFTAFAVGGLLPTLFGQALAPSLSRRFRDRALPRKLLPALLTVLALSAGLALAIYLNLNAFRIGSHPPGFWLACALSVAGGALMSLALWLRTRLIQEMKGDLVYGPDLLANVLIATSAPFVHSMFGVEALAGLYLLSGVLNLGFYLGAARGLAVGRRGLTAALGLIAAALVLPVFFQLCGGLFDDPAIVFDAGGDINRLPLPISLAAVFVGIAAVGNYQNAIRSLTTLFFTAILFVMTSLLMAAGDEVHERAKLILLAQFLLPMFGMVLGEMFAAASRAPCFERAAALVLLAVLPAQMAASWLQGQLTAVPHVFFFSIYQHLQYLPSIVAATAGMASMALWNAGRGWRLAVCVLWPLAMLQLAASGSGSALAGAMAGMGLFSAWHAMNSSRKRQLRAVTMASLTACLVYVALAHSSWLPQQQLDSAQPLAASTQEDLARPTQPVTHYWSLYAEGATASLGTFLLGHAERPDRQQMPSAHNYWLDAIYNFGIIPIAPFILLLGGTARLAWQKRRGVLRDPVLLGTLFAAAYLVLGESMIKVGMRQAYPGLMTMFILGLLMARLRALDVQQNPA